MNDVASSPTAPKYARALIVRALLIAVVEVAGALVLKLAHKHGLIDRETVARLSAVLIGLGLAAYGNIMPKFLEGSPPKSPALAALRQSVSRTSGWAMTLAGLAYAALWAFAPHDVASIGCIVAVGAAVAIMFANFAWRVCTYQRGLTH